MEDSLPLPVLFHQQWRNKLDGNCRTRLMPSWSISASPTAIAWATAPAEKGKPNQTPFWTSPGPWHSRFASVPLEKLWACPNSHQEVISLLHSVRNILGTCDYGLHHGGDTQQGRAWGAQPAVAAALPAFHSVSATWLPRHPEQGEELACVGSCSPPSRGFLWLGK